MYKWCSDRFSTLRENPSEESYYDYLHYNSTWPSVRVLKERMRSEEAQWISCACSNQCLTTLSVRPYDDSENNQPYSKKNEGNYIYKTHCKHRKNTGYSYLKYRLDFLNTTSHTVQRTKASIYTKPNCKHRKNTGYFYLKYRHSMKSTNFPSSP